MVERVWGKCGAKRQGGHESGKGRQRTLRRQKEAEKIEFPQQAVPGREMTLTRGR